MDCKLNGWIIVIDPQHGGDSKLFSSTLTIGTCDNWCMNVEKAVVVEKVVRRKGHGVSNAHGSRMKTGTWSEMSHFAHVFQRVSLFGKRIEHSSHLCTCLVASIDSTQQFSSSNLQLDSLTSSLTGDECSNKLKGRSSTTRLLALFKASSFVDIQDTVQRSTA